MNRIRALAALLLVLVFSLPGAPAAMAAGNYSSLDLIFDEANILDDQTVVGYLNGLDLPEGTRVAVLTSDDPSLRKDTYDADIYNYVTAQGNPDLLDDSLTGFESKTWLVTISPQLRKIGLYGSDDTGINPDLVKDAVAAMRTPAGAGKWNNVPKAAMQAAGDWLHDHRPLTPEEQAERDRIAAEERAQKAEAEARRSEALTQAMLFGLGLAGTLGSGVGLFFGGRWLRKLSWKGPDPTLAAAALAAWRSADDVYAKYDLGPTEVASTIDLLSALEANDFLATYSERMDPSFRERVTQAIEGADQALALAEENGQDVETEVDLLLSRAPKAKDDWSKAREIAAEARIEGRYGTITTGAALGRLDLALGEGGREELFSARHLRQPLKDTIEAAPKALAEIRNQADFALGRGNWEPRWNRTYDEVIGTPLALAAGSLNGLAEHLSVGDLSRARLLVDRIEDEAQQVDAVVRDGKMYPPVGVRELERLAEKLSDGVQEASQSLSVRLQSQLSTQSARAYARQYRSQPNPYSFDATTAILLWSVLPREQPPAPVYQSSRDDGPVGYTQSYSPPSPPTFSSFDGGGGGGGFSGGSGDF